MGAESILESGLCSVRGPRFSAWLDENDGSFRIHRRRPDSTLPTSAYGRDYELVDSGKAPSEPGEAVSERWGRGEAALPTLDVGLRVHRLLFRVLEAAGARPPFNFT